jgi:toxin ParE1/3/4
MRTFAFGNYLILHRAREGGVDIVRVVHGAREWEGLV